MNTSVIAKELLNGNGHSNGNGKKLKNPIKFQLQLNEEQKLAKQKILENTLTILVGRAGSGKTLLAVQCGLDLLFTKQCDKIIITRPTVSKEEIGFLPGTLEEKMDPWVAPIYANMYQLYNKEKIDSLIKDRSIEIIPVAYMRGRTFLNSVIIVDESQNILDEQLIMIISRIGLNSKMIICGDTKQIDLKNKKTSGLHFLSGIKSVEGMCIIELLKNHRHPIVDKLLDIYHENNKF